MGSTSPVCIRMHHQLAGRMRILPLSQRQHFVSLLSPQAYYRMIKYSKQLPKDAPQNCQTASSLRHVAWEALRADTSKSSIALPPIVPRGGQGEERFVKWAEPCASSMPAKRNVQGYGSH